MAIQKINLGTEPLGEGGDTYRSANTKINENFSNTTHAASRLVGTANGQIPLAEQVGSLALKSTKKDSKTNLLLNPEDSVPENSAASRLVGRGNGQVPVYEGTGLSGLGYGGVAKYITGVSTTNDMSTTGFYALHANNLLALPNEYYDRYAAMLHISSLPGYAARIIMSNIANGELLFQFAEWESQGTSTQRPYHRVYHSGNTNKGTNGALTAKSPVSHLYHDRVEHTGSEKELQPIKFVKQGVGDYLLKNTTGLAQEGWYIVIPHDANGNPLIAVEYEDNDGDINIRTYKRKFDYEQAKVVADHDNPMDIPETRWIDLRFNDDPSLYDEEQLDEPTVDEVVNPEVVKEPSEDSK